jgi:SAM-dependent methyltransferase
MTPGLRYSDYDDFAWMYNRHWGDRFTPVAVAVIERLVLPGLPAGAAVLDLCCGTGQLARELSGRGYTVTGLDGSGEMLKFARENAPGARFILDDARTFNLPAKYDTVVSVFDSLNHVMELEELAAVFRNVRGCLKPGGRFLFDMNMEPGYLKKWQGFYGIVEDDHVCLFPNSYDADRRTGRVDFTIFRLDDTGWRRTDFSLTQKCYAEGEIRSALAGAGFSDVEGFAYDRDNRLAALTPDSGRAFFLCRKQMA